MGGQQRLTPSTAEAAHNICVSQKAQSCAGGMSALMLQCCDFHKRRARTHHGDAVAAGEGAACAVAHVLALYNISKGSMVHQNLISKHLSRDPAISQSDQHSCQYCRVHQALDLAL